MKRPFHSRARECDRGACECDLDVDHRRDVSSGATRNGAVPGDSRDALLSLLTPVSAVKGLPYLLHQGEVLSLRDHHKRILRPILGLGRDRYVFAVYHPCWLVTTPGVLISGHIG